MALRGSGAEVRYVKSGTAACAAYLLADGGGVVLGNLFARSQEGVSTAAPPQLGSGRQPCAARQRRASSHRELLGTLCRLPPRCAGPGDLGSARPDGRAAVLSGALPRSRHLLLLDRRHRRSPRCAARGQLGLPHRERLLPARAFPGNGPARGHPGSRRRMRRDPRRRLASASSIGIRCRSPTPRRSKTSPRRSRRMRQCVRDVVHAWASCYDHMLLSLSGGLDSSIVLACLKDAPSRPRVTCFHYYPLGADLDERAYARAAAAKAGLELLERPRDSSFSLQPLLTRAPRAGADQLSLFPRAQPARGAARRRVRRHRAGHRLWRRSALLSGSRRVGARGFPPPPRAAARRAAGRARCRADGSDLDLARVGAGDFRLPRTPALEPPAGGGTHAAVARAGGDRGGEAQRRVFCIRCCVIRGARRAASSGTRIRSASRSISTIRWAAKAMRSGSRRSSRSRSWSSACAFQPMC